MLHKLTLATIGALFCISNAIADSGPKSAAASDTLLNKNPTREKDIKKHAEPVSKNHGLASCRSKNATGPSRCF